MPKALELRAEKADRIGKAEAINARADAENRDLNEQEQAEFDGHLKRARELDGEISRADRREGLDEARQELRRSQGRRVPAGGAGDFDTKPDYGSVLRNWMLAGTEHADFSSEAMYRAQQCGINPFGKTITLRALSTGADPGSHLIGKTYADTLVETLRKSSRLLSAVTFDVTTDGNPRTYPSEDDTANEAIIVGENTDLDAADPDFDSVEVPVYLYSSKLVKASISMLQDSRTNLEAYIAKTVAARIRRALTKHCTIGTGSGQPHGLTAAAGAGVSVAAGVASPTYDHFVDLEHSITEENRENCQFMMSDSTLKLAKKLKDDEGRPLWLPAMSAAAPATILGRPYMVLPDLAAWGNGAIPLLFGDPSGLVVRQAMDVTIARADERFMELGQVAWVALARFGARYIGNAAKLKKLSIAAS